MKIRRMYLVITSIVSILSILAFCVLFFHAGYDDKVLLKLKIKSPEEEIDWAVFSWDSCLEKLHYDSDIAFFGDSLTRGGDFQDSFTDKTIINLGCSGDSIENATERVSMLKHTSPEKIFVMVGINCLTDNNIDSCLEAYSTLLASIKETLPQAQVYVQSVLPISKEKEKTICSNDTIETFNLELERLAHQNQMTYVDLFSVFSENNQLNASLSEDGLHINSSGYELWINAITPYIY